MSVSKVDWASLRVKTPDPKAANTPPLPLLILFNSLSTAGLLVSLPVVIPYTILKHFLVGPRAKWMDLKSHLLSNIIRLALLRFSFFLPGVDSSAWRIPRPWRNKPPKGAEGVKATIVTIQPATTPREGFAVCPAVEAVPVPGFMLAPKGLDGKSKAGAGEKAVLYFVGGAYAFGHPLERPFAWTMCQAFGVRVLGVNYRKVLTAATSFPAPLLDALAGWDYLTRDLGFAPENITLIGESAGAHLCLMLSRYLADIDQPGPGALALSGPWCDLSPTSTARPSMTKNYGTDYIPWLGKLSSRSASRHYSMKAKNGPYIAPAKASVEEWKYLAQGQKVYIHAGQMELLIDEIRITAKGMQNAGVDLTVVEEEGGIHVSPTMANFFTAAHSWEVFRDDVRPIVRREK